METTPAFDWESLTYEERLIAASAQLAHWRRVKQLLRQERAVRTPEERLAIRAELQARIRQAAPASENAPIPEK